jgi:predicted acylesterase/phospholipase RssA
METIPGEWSNDPKEHSGAHRKDKLPKNPFSNIAISLSGGGFRATAFHLGSLTYLSTLDFQGANLLERTRILSTASAGTFTGVKYATTLKKGGTIKDCYQSLYAFMNDRDLVSEALQYLSDDANWTSGRSRTLINAFAAIYHKHFESELFGLLWEEEKPIHLKEISFNATEFNFALPFRFQKTERLRYARPDHEFIGNKKIHIPVELAKELRLSDIIAASCCFPFGFEPINFPDDFIHDKAVHLKDPSLLPKHVFDGDIINYPIGLMDGAIDDNQGVDAVVIAEERMKHYEDELTEFRSDDEKAVDLYIISDVSPRNMASYASATSDGLSRAGKWHFQSLKHFGIFSAALGASTITAATLFESKTMIILLAILGTLFCLTAVFLLIFSVGLTWLTRKAGVPDFVVKRLLHFDKLKFGTLYNMFINRKNSAMKLVSEVFLKQMRWFSYERVYSDPAWKPRLIMNAAFELTKSEVQRRKRKYSFLHQEMYEPSEDIILAANIASSVSTKLWFTPEELDGPKNKLNSLIACGQFTTCFNLLKYYEKFLKHPRYKEDYEQYSEETKKALDILYTALMEDWKKFKKNPYWMVNEWNKQAHQ